MIVGSVFNSVEFYVIASVIAAAVIAFIGRKPQNGPAVSFLLPGITSSEEKESSPSIEFICCEDGSVILRRHALTGLTSSDTINLNVNKIGFDIKISEQIVYSSETGYPIDTASFLMDFMGREHYFISYESALTNSASPMFASVNLHNRDGNRLIKKLQ